MKYRQDSRRRAYDAKWQRLRAVQLATEPLCRYCRELGITTPATEVDHIVPIREAPERRLDQANLQSLCAGCHRQVKQSEEATGRRVGCGADGVPLDGGHHWNGGGGSNT